MPRYFKARRAREVRAFLIAYEFVLQSTSGDDDIYRRPNYHYAVKIPNRDNDEIPNGTMSYIRKCIRYCSINDKKMPVWWKNNGFGE